jgi:hypothetical protein
MGKIKSINSPKLRRKLISECDNLVSLIVRKRDKRCVCCGSSEKLTAGHLITRSAHIVRFDLTNNNCQCSSCNFLHEYRPERYIAWWVNHYGLESYLNLVQLSKQTKHWTVAELLELKQELQKRLNELEGA